MTDPHDTLETRTESQDNAKALARETGQPITDPLKLVAPMLARFMATDRAFKKFRSQHNQAR
jgi:hypothetical protein